MIALDTFTLAAVASEMRRALIGARVQKIQQPSPADIILSLYGRAGAQRLLVSADPQTFRVHLTQVKRENPVTPPGFCQVCRKYLEGAWLDEIVLPHFDRVLRLGFRAHDGERATLVAELMGRNSNVVLVSGTGLVRGVLRSVPSGGGGERELRPGSVYADPPGYGEKPDPPSVQSQDAPPADDPKAAKTWLMDTFGGIGPFAADEIVFRARQSANSLGAVFAALMDDVRAERFAPHSVMNETGTATEGVWAFAPLSVPAARRFERDSVSVALDTFYATRTQQTTEAGAQNDLRRALEREITYRERETAAAEATLAEAGRADDYESQGNLLLASLTLIERGASSATVPDLYASETGATRTITLDPKRSPQENAEAFFERARKARDAAEHAENRLDELSEDLAELRALASEAERAEDDATRERVRQALAGIIGAQRAAAAGAKTRGAAQKPRPKEKPFGGHRVRTYSVDGYELWVGETAEANDYLVTRASSPTDLWLHVRAGVGAHGILRTQGQPTRVGDPTVRRAAQIVAARSGKSVKHTDLVAVDVTERRYVRKPRAAKPGLVTYERERTLDVSPAL